MAARRRNAMIPVGMARILAARPTEVRALPPESVRSGSCASRIAQRPEFIRRSLGEGGSGPLFPSPKS
ncbi:MAG: hypothetical protein PHI93_11405, partial [Kiritimatiellae bacterium]|nr:hypothetical protein [Kiritimatiellia bacterium]